MYHGIQSKHQGCRCQEYTNDDLGYTQTEQVYLLEIVWYLGRNQPREDAFHESAALLYVHAKKYILVADMVQSRSHQALQ